MDDRYVTHAGRRMLRVRGADDTEPDSTESGQGTETETPDSTEETKVTISQKEWNAAQRERAELRRQSKKAEEEASQREEAEQREKGEQNKLLDEKNARIAELEGKTAAAERRQKLLAAAYMADFRNPEDAVSFLGEQEIEDDEAAKKAVADLKRERPYLIEVKGALTGDLEKVLSDGKPGSSTTDLTAADVKSMTREQINERWDEVQAALKQG